MSDDHSHGHDHDDTIDHDPAADGASDRDAAGWTGETGGDGEGRDESKDEDEEETESSVRPSVAAEPYPGATTARARAAAVDGDPDAAPLSLKGVTKEYETGGETVRALIDVAFTVEAGEFIAVVGPSGSGKSTMLNMLGLLDAPTTGTVRLYGRDVTDFTDRELTRARRVALGFVFQSFYLIPTLTALENVELPTMFERDPDARDRASDLLTRVGLGDRLDHTPDELSGGQKQRVAIARSLINEPGVILADEPTGNLDRDTGRSVLDELRRICATGVAVVAVTHDELVTEYADRTVDLVDGHLRTAAAATTDGSDAAGHDGGNRETPNDERPIEGGDSASTVGADRATTDREDDRR